MSQTEVISDKTEDKATCGLNVKWRLRPDADANTDGAVQAERERKQGESKKSGVEAGQALLLPG